MRPTFDLIQRVARTAPATAVCYDRTFIEHTRDSLAWVSVCGSRTLVPASKALSDGRDAAPSIAHPSPKPRCKDLQTPDHLLNGNWLAGLRGRTAPERLFLVSLLTDATLCLLALVSILFCFWHYGFWRGILAIIAFLVLFVVGRRHLLIQDPTPAVLIIYIVQDYKIIYEPRCIPGSPSEFGIT